MATQKEHAKINDLDKRISLLANDLMYISGDITEVKEEIKGQRGDLKTLSDAISKLSFVTHEELETYKKAVSKEYVNKTDFQKLASKIQPILWFSGIATAAVVTGIIAAVIAWIVNGGLSK